MNKLAITSFPSSVYTLASIAVAMLCGCTSVDGNAPVKLTTATQSAIVAPVGYSKESRFDSAGMVIEWECAGHSFFTSCNAPGVKSSFGTDYVAGTAEEFREKIGYDAAVPGECFFSPGVGICRRIDSKEYSLNVAYPVVKRFPWKVVRHSDASVTFSQKSPAWNGYAYHYTKTATLEDKPVPRLVMRYSLENTGSKELVTLHYAHNFICIDQMPVSSDYVVDYGFDTSFKRPGLSDNIKNRRLTIDKKVGTWGDLVIGAVDANDNWFKVTYLPSKTALLIRCDFVPESAFQWFNNRAVTPESFLRIRLRPGEKQEWEIAYIPEFPENPFL